MKKPGVAMLVFAGTAVSVASIYAQPAASQSLVPPVATISFSEAVMQTNEAKRDFAALQTKFAPRQAELEKLNADIESLQKQLNDQKDALSDTELNLRTQLLNSKEKQLQRTEEDYRSDSQSEGQNAFNKIAQKVLALVQGYAKDHGYTVVMDRGNQQSPVVLWAAEDTDITTRIVAAYNAKSGIAPPAPTSSPGGVSSRTPPSQR